MGKYAMKPVSKELVLVQRPCENQSQRNEMKLQKNALVLSQTKLKQNNLQYIQSLCDWRGYVECLLTDGLQAQVRSNFYGASYHCSLLYSHA